METEREREREMGRNQREILSQSTNVSQRPSAPKIQGKGDYSPPLLGIGGTKGSTLPPGGACFSVAGEGGKAEVGNKSFPLLVPLPCSQKGLSRPRQDDTWAQPD